MKSNFKNPQAKKTVDNIYENYFILNYCEENIIVQLFEVLILFAWLLQRCQLLLFQFPF